VGPTRTVPPDPPATPRGRRPLDNDPLELDRPPATPAEPSTPAEPWPLRAAPLGGTDEEPDLAGDLLAPEPLPDRLEVIDSHRQAAEPLGRHIPEPLDAAREGVER
jgi:hypothetical protein